MVDKRKVLLVQNTINEYRVQTYNLINEVFDLTVAYDTEDQTKSECYFSKIKLPSKRIGPFNVFGSKFWAECKKYDAVITSFNIHNFEFMFVPFIKRRYKLLTWSIGFRCSYTRPYDVNRKHTFLDKISYAILNAADANIFYMDKAREFWKFTKLDQSKIFIAPNTTGVIETNSDPKKSSILFVGTLYKAKGVDKLIKAFKTAISRCNCDITLDIVGKGEERKSLELLVRDLNIEDKVIFHGPIYEEERIGDLFGKALISISPTQAGLSVPKSMGYGVPVVTKINAITGGELYHIKNNNTGIIYHDDSELTEIIIRAIERPDDFLKMGLRAKQYYDSYATPIHQAQGAIDAITYALNI